MGLRSSSRVVSGGLQQQQGANRQSSFEPRASWRSSRREVYNSSERAVSQRAVSQRVVLPSVLPSSSVLHAPFEFLLPSDIRVNPSQNKPPFESTLVSGIAAQTASYCRSNLSLTSPFFSAAIPPLQLREHYGGRAILVDLRAVRSTRFLLLPDFAKASWGCVAALVDHGEDWIFVRWKSVVRRAVLFLQRGLEAFIGEAVLRRAVP